MAKTPAATNANAPLKTRGMETKLQEHGLDCRPKFVNISNTEATRRPIRGLLPAASEESAANPVSVNVNTVVVMSGTASRRTVALRKPIATAVRIIAP